MELVNLMRKLFKFIAEKTEILIKSKKIALVILLLLIVRFNPGAVNNSEGFPDRMVPGSIRLTNSNSSGAEFEECCNIVGSFMKKWTIEGASVAIATAVTSFEILAILNLLYGWISIPAAVSAYPNPLA